MTYWPIETKWRRNFFLDTKNKNKSEWKCAEFHALSAWHIQIWNQGVADFWSYLSVSFVCKSAIISIQSISFRSSILDNNCWVCWLSLICSSLISKSLSTLRSNNRYTRNWFGTDDSYCSFDPRSSSSLSLLLLFLSTLGNKTVVKSTTYSTVW